LGDTTDFDRLIPHVTVTSRCHALFGQQLEVVQLVSDRGPIWVTVRVPNGGRRNIRRAQTDLAQPLADSKRSPLVSSHILLRVAKHAEALSQCLEKERRNDKDDIAGDVGDPAATLVQSAGAVPATIGRTDRACATPDATRSLRR
jgi:hypothetical protein